MKTVLLSGARGFIGRWTIPMLEASGYRVHAVSSSQEPLPDSAAEWHVCNLLDVKAVGELVESIRPTHLLHFAWVTEPGVYWTSLLNEEWKRSSIALVDRFADCGGRRAVVAGTCAEYDWTTGHCIEDETPLVPATLYGTCKRDVHRYVECTASERGFSAAWGHIFHLYGPREHPKRLVPSVICGLLRGARVPSTIGTQVRDFLHVGDVASAFVALLESDCEGSVNVASGDPVSVRTVIETIARALRQGDLVDWGSMPLPSSEPPSLTAATQRLREEVGWSPAFTLEEGIRETIEWWRKHLRLQL
jgi:nucleoside-diphosphate-sugar epimerase